MRHLIQIILMAFLVCCISACGEKAGSSGSSSGSGGGGGGSGGGGGDGGSGATSLRVESESISIARGAHIDWGLFNVGETALSKVFFVSNVGNDDINLTNGPEFIKVSGAEAFSVSLQPDDGLVMASEANIQAFVIDFDPLGAGNKSAVFSFKNDEANTSYSFTISAQALLLTDPEIVILGPSDNIIDSDGGNSPSVENHTDFGKVPLNSTKLVEFQITSD
jgi:hypothetical protein